MWNLDGDTSWKTDNWKTENEMGFIEFQFPLIFSDLRNGEIRNQWP